MFLLLPLLLLLQLFHILCLSLEHNDMCVCFQGKITYFLADTSADGYLAQMFHGPSRTVLAIGTGSHVLDSDLIRISTGGHYWNIGSENQLPVIQDAVLRSLCL